MPVSSMVNFDELLGHARFEHLAESAANHEERVRRLEEENTRLRNEVAELRGECEVARAYRLQGADAGGH